jgi:P27 family predicted phage terminase small subunit
MVNAKKPTAPRHLRPKTRRWWSDVVGDWSLEQHHVRLLTLACESWDRCQEAREAIAAEGITTKDRFGQTRVHPAVNVERDAKIGFSRLLRELDLDVDPPKESSGRPPMLRSIAK